MNSFSQTSSRWHSFPSSYSIKNDCEDTKFQAPVTLPVAVNCAVPIDSCRLRSRNKTGIPNHSGSTFQLTRIPKSCLFGFRYVGTKQNKQKTKCSEECLQLNNDSKGYNANKYRTPNTDSATVLPLNPGLTRRSQANYMLVETIDTDRFVVFFRT